MRVGGRETQKEGGLCTRWLIHVVQQKLTQHCKAITPPLKTNKEIHEKTALSHLLYPYP